jgi:hypothetical protein
VKFVIRAAGYSLLDHRRNEGILEVKVDPVQKKLAQYESRIGLILLGVWNSLDTQKNSLTDELSEDDH